VNYTLNVLIRHQINEKNRFPRVSLDAIANETPDNDWCSSTGFLENASQDLLADELTPENLVIAKELQNLISNHFGEDDTAVLLGWQNRESEAGRLKISKEAYCKRLQRKTGFFKDVLEEAGYIPSQP
jgi:hypothetical protein